jgi:hypothetical protein
MREMRWSWKQLHDETPPYVRRYCLDLMMVRRRVEHEKAEQRERERRG